MPNSPLITIGLEMPTDFPIRPYEAIHSRMITKRDTHYESWYEYGAAWNAVAYRFLSCTEHSNEFTNSIRRSGNSPPQPERYKQEKELFGFFVAGLAMIESFCYGLFAIGSILSPLYFPIRTPENKRSMTPENTIKELNLAFTNNPPITTTL